MAVTVSPTITAGTDSTATTGATGPSFRRSVTIRAIATVMGRVTVEVPDIAADAGSTCATRTGVVIIAIRYSSPRAIAIVGTTMIDAAVR
ncbi:MAG: hypothetical protein DHS20C19_30210 [Acidimicrobiales bacterium]|nr:MAG: hypothetical protein DHS20C19_30210 [Acidimicrobiales bacterium]